MTVRSVALAFVSSVYLVALGANFGSALAFTNPVTTQAYQALASGDSAKAISLYSFAIESRGLEPEVLANALLNRALAFQQQGQQAKAVDDYTAALSLDAMSAELRAIALYNRGLSQQKLGSATLAIEDFTSALMLNPSFAHAFLSRANVLRDSGQYLFALSDYERALKFGHPEPARVYFGEAQTYELLKRPNDMRRMLNSAVMSDASFQPAQDKLASLGAEQTSDANGANSDSAAVDPIATGSIIAVGGASVIHKPDLPKGVEPPANLTEVSEASDTLAAPDTAQPVFEKTPKLFTDRLPASDEALASAAPDFINSAKEPEKDVAVNQVPAIPKSVKAKPSLAAVAAPSDDQQSDSSETTSTNPVRAQSAKPASIVGWGVQIVSAASEDAAWASWKTMQKHSRVLADKKPVVIKADLGSKVSFTACA